MKILCQECGEEIEATGKQIKCPKCGKVNKIPYLV